MPADATLAHLLWTLLGAVIYPLWLAAGVADVLVHRRDRIWQCAGAYESALHVVLCLQMAIPVLLVLFLDFTLPVFIACLALVAMHSITSWADSRFADSVRHIGPGEQKLHVALDAIPWIGLALVAVLQWPLLHASPVHPTGDWSVRLRQPAFDSRVIASVLATSFVFGLLPSLIEWLRARRHRASPAL